MKTTSTILKNISVTVGILCVSFLLCLAIQNIVQTQTLVPSIFVLGAFITSILTDGYAYGMTSALISVVAVNYAFTFPFFKFDITMPENVVSAVILIVVSLMTCALTTKLKRQDALKIESEKERTRANLLRAISHDLRTPLTTIYGSSSAMLENPDSFTPEQKAKMLQGIKEDAQWLSRMVENLLSITKLDNGNVKIFKTPTVLDELVDSVLIKFSKRYPEQKVKVDIPDVFISIPMDAILIEQVLVNILENAVQHAKGMTILSLKVFLIANKAIFEIKDNGCGVDAERLKTIFSGNPISEQAPSDGKKSNAGIGLSVCATIIKAHGGDIRAENLKDGGMLFRFILDLEDAENEQ